MSQKRNINWSVSDAKLREKIPRLEIILRQNILYRQLSEKVGRVYFNSDIHCIVTELKGPPKNRREFEDLQMLVGSFADTQGLVVETGYGDGLISASEVEELNKYVDRLEAIKGYKFTCSDNK